MKNKNLLDRLIEWIETSGIHLEFLKESGYEICDYQTEVCKLQFKISVNTTVTKDDKHSVKGPGNLTWEV